MIFFVLQELFKYFNTKRKLDSGTILKVLTRSSQKFIRHGLSQAPHLTIFLFELLCENNSTEGINENLWFLYSKCLTETLEDLKRHRKSTPLINKDDLLTKSLLLLLASFKPDQVFIKYIIIQKLT